MVADKLNVRELMTTSLVALPPIVPVSVLVDTLQKHRHHSFPVTPDTEKAWNSDEHFDLHGVITRPVLLRLVKHRLGFIELARNQPVCSPLGPFEGVQALCGDIPGHSIVPFHVVGNARMQMQGRGC
jgi:CBS domain-containing protein